MFKPSYSDLRAITFAGDCNKKKGDYSQTINYLLNCFIFILCIFNIIKNHVLSDISNELGRQKPKPKPNEALQLLLKLHSPCTNVHEEGIFLYDQKDNLYYVYDIQSGDKFYTFFLKDAKGCKGKPFSIGYYFLKT